MPEIQNNNYPKTVKHSYIYKNNKLCFNNSNISNSTASNDGFLYHDF